LLTAHRAWLMQALQGVWAFSGLSECLKCSACIDEEALRTRESGCAHIMSWWGCWLRLGLLCMEQCARHAGTLLDILSARQSSSWTCPPPQVFTCGNTDWLAGLHGLVEGHAHIDAGAERRSRTVRQVAILGHKSWCSSLWKGCRQRKWRWWPSQ